MIYACGAVPGAAVAKHPRSEAEWEGTHAPAWRGRPRWAVQVGVRLGIGYDLTRIALDPKHPRKLASEAELLALRPELNHIE